MIPLCFKKFGSSLMLLFAVGQAPAACSADVRKYGQSIFTHLESIKDAQSFADFRTGLQGIYPRLGIGIFWPEGNLRTDASRNTDHRRKKRQIRSAEKSIDIQTERVLEHQQHEN